MIYHASNAHTRSSLFLHLHLDQEMTNCAVLQTLTRDQASSYPGGLGELRGSVLELQTLTRDHASAYPSADQGPSISRIGFKRSHAIKPLPTWPRNTGEAVTPKGFKRSHAIKPLPTLSI